MKWRNALAPGEGNYMMNIDSSIELDKLSMTDSSSFVSDGSSSFSIDSSTL